MPDPEAPKTGSARGETAGIKGEENFPDKPPSKHAESLADLMERDFSLRISSRELMGKCLLGLLICQNIGLAWVVFNYTKLGLGEVALGTIVGATLLETAAVIHTMVKFLFKDLPYKSRIY